MTHTLLLHIYLGIIGFSCDIPLKLSGVISSENFVWKLSRSATYIFLLQSSHLDK